MKYTELKKEVESFLKEPVILKKGEPEFLLRGLHIISDDFGKLIAGKKLEQNNERFNVLLNCLLCISAHILESPMHDRFVSVALAYSELIFNWNSNVQKDEVLRQLCLYISRTCEIRNDLIITTNVLKDVDDRLRELSSWSPPSYEIAKEYFEKLLEENERGKE